MPAIGAVSILELAVNGGSSRMSQVTNLHIATQLFMHFYKEPEWEKDCRILNREHKWGEVGRSVHCVSSFSTLRVTCAKFQQLVHKL